MERIAPSRTRRRAGRYQSRKLLYCSGKSVTSLRTMAMHSCSKSRLAPDTRSVALNRRLHLQLAVLDQTHQLFGQLGVHAHFDGDGLLDPCCR